MSPSHYGVGIQLADMFAGAVARKFTAKHDYFFKMIEESLRKSPHGQIGGLWAGEASKGKLDLRSRRRVGAEPPSCSCHTPERVIKVANVTVEINSNRSIVNCRQQQAHSGTTGHSV